MGVPDVIGRRAANTFTIALGGMGKLALPVVSIARGAYSRPAGIGIGAPRCPVTPDTPSGRSASFGLVRSGLPQIFSSVALSVGRIHTFETEFSDPRYF